MAVLVTIQRDPEGNPLQTALHKDAQAVRIANGQLLVLSYAGDEANPIAVYAEGAWRSAERVSKEAA